MKYAVIYDSKTGNTKKLSEKIFQCLDHHDVIYFGNVEGYTQDADVYFIGFWTDKGSCSEELQKFLIGLHGKKIILFGTAGFGGSKEYYDAILDCIKACIDVDNEIVDTFMCQGKMPIVVRKRYEAILEEHPEDQKAIRFLDNFDNASSHPDEQDYHRLQTFMQTVLANFNKE